LRVSPWYEMPISYLRRTSANSTLTYKNDIKAGNPAAPTRRVVRSTGLQAPRPGAKPKHQLFGGLARDRRLWLNALMFEIDQLACLRGERLLFRKLGCTLAAGSLLRVAGANGTGKTSLLRLLAGLGEPAAGQIRWQGKPIQTQRETFNAALCYLGHAATLSDLLTPEENLHFACLSAGIAASPQECCQTLQEIGLAAQLDLPCKVLSQGQRRRVALARLTLAATRPLWILDEPFTALDQAAIEELAGRCSAHCAAGGIVIFTSHQDVSFTLPQQTLKVEDFAP
jgi:heme exporter protein A